MRAAWVSVFLLAGYFFGNLAIVQQNFSLVTYAIIGLSLAALASVFFTDLPLDEITKRRPRLTDYKNPVNYPRDIYGHSLVDGD